MQHPCLTHKPHHAQGEDNLLQMTMDRVRRLALAKYSPEVLHCCIDLLVKALAPELRAACGSIPDLIPMMMQTVGCLVAEKLPPPSGALCKLLLLLPKDFIDLLSSIKSAVPTDEPGASLKQEMVGSMLSSMAAGYHCSAATHAACHCSECGPYVLEDQVQVLSHINLNEILPEGVVIQLLSSCKSRYQCMECSRRGTPSGAADDSPCAHGTSMGSPLPGKRRKMKSSGVNGSTEAQYHLKQAFKFACRISGRHLRRLSVSEVVQVSSTCKFLPSVIWQEALVAGMWPAQESIGSGISPPSKRSIDVRYVCDHVGVPAVRAQVPACLP